MKHKTIVRRRRADDDIETAIAFYLEEAGTDVAMVFANHLQEALRTISRQPTIGSTRYGEVSQISSLRHWPIKNFPYLIFYVERNNVVEVVRVLHGRTDIPSWLVDLE